MNLSKREQGSLRATRKIVGRIWREGIADYRRQQEIAKSNPTEYDDAALCEAWDRYEWGCRVGSACASLLGLADEEDDDYDPPSLYDIATMPRL